MEPLEPGQEVPPQPPPLEGAREPRGSDTAPGSQDPALPITSRIPALGPGNS